MDPVHQNHARHEHEHSDVHVRGIVTFMIILVVSGVAIHFVLSGMWSYFNRVASPDAQSPFAGPRQLPPQPRLQATPRADLQTYLASEQQRLESYGTDPDTGSIHIPIGRAVDLLAERGLPSRRQPPGGQQTTGPSPGVKPAPSPSPAVQGPRPERVGQKEQP